MERGQLQPASVARALQVQRRRVRKALALQLHLRPAPQERVERGQRAALEAVALLLQRRPAPEALAEPGQLPEARVPRGQRRQAPEARVEPGQ